jgi:hypothetical protein
LARGIKAYDDAVRVVAQSRSTTLIHALEQIHKYLNTTALTNFLAARQWQEFKDAIAAAIGEIENLCEVAKASDSGPGGAKDDSQTSQVMKPEDALKILGLKEGCNRDAVDKAYKKLILRFGAHPNANLDLESSIVADVEKIAIKLGEAKLTLLQTLKEKA